jgi:hypothetical protein
MPDALESVPGAAPEVTVHSESAFVNVNDELSPQEEAMNGVTEIPVEDKTETLDDGDGDTAALAEGLIAPPLTDPDKL